MIVTTMIVAVMAMITVIAAIVSAGMIVPTATHPGVTGGGVGPVTGRPNVVHAGAGRSRFNNGCRRSHHHRSGDNWQSEIKAEANAGIGGHGSSGCGTDENGQEDGFGFHILPFYFVLVGFVFCLSLFCLLYCFEIYFFH